MVANLKEALNDLIGENQIDLAIDLAKQHCENEYVSKFIHLKGRLTRLQEEEMLGTVSQRSSNIDYNKIRQALLRYIEVSIR